MPPFIQLSTGLYAIEGNNTPAGPGQILSIMTVSGENNDRWLCATRAIDDAALSSADEGVSAWLTRGRTYFEQRFSPKARPCVFES